MLLFCFQIEELEAKIKQLEDEIEELRNKIGALEELRRRVSFETALDGILVVYRHWGQPLLSDAIFQNGNDIVSLKKNWLSMKLNL